MSVLLRSCWRKMLPLLGGAILLAAAAEVYADPKPLSKEEQAKVDKAIEKAIAYLKKTQTDKGDWPDHPPGLHHLGQSLLPAYALLESGVLAKDPVIQKATEYFRPEVAKYLRSNVRRQVNRNVKVDQFQTYQLSLALLFFDKLGDPKDKELIRSLALRLIAGQHWTGGWGYFCLKVKEDDEEALFKCLTTLDKRIEEGEKPSAKLIRDLDVPRSLRMLAVFQDRGKLTLHEAEKGAEDPVRARLDIGPTDNSNTQFAMLALWVAQRHGIPVRASLELLVKRFEHSQLADGRWPYAVWSRPPTPSMVCVGLMGLAIGRGLQIPPYKRTRPDAGDATVLKSLAALYREVGFPVGATEKPAPLRDVYFLWSLERVAMLYDLPTLGDKEWYRWGAQHLLALQTEEGCWPESIKPNSPTLVTAFALLFLKHSHPMKDLTPKLPFKPKELNEGIARLVPQRESSDNPDSSRQSKPDR